LLCVGGYLSIPLINQRRLLGRKCDNSAAFLKMKRHYLGKEGRLIQEVINARARHSECTEYAEFIT
jgi:hypothetical protein